MRPAPATLFALLVATFVVPVSCGPRTEPVPAGLSGNGPFLTQAAGQVRMIVVTANAAIGPAMIPASCTLQGYLFDTITQRALQVLGSEGECTLYAGPQDLALESQSWTCAGAIIARYGSHQEVLTMCRAMGEPLRPEVPVACEDLSAGATLRVSSDPNEIDGDVVPDLDVSVTLPGAVTIMEPSALGVTTWAPSGPLAVRWTSSDATSALVTLQPRSAAPSSPLLVCQPRTNGQVTVPASLIDMANFRGQDVILRVASYRDVTTTAEGMTTYRVSGGLSAGVLLQARR